MADPRIGRAIRDAPPLPEPMIESCVRMNTNARDRQGVIRFIRNKVLVKRGSSTLFTRAGNVALDMELSVSSSSSSSSSSMDSASNSSINGNEDGDVYVQRAYLICDKIHQAIYGSVYRGKVLERSSPDDVWQITNEVCAIKAMFWDRVREGRQTNRAENPQDEISAMKHIVQCLTGITGEEASAHDIMRERKVVVPLDFLYDDQYLYTITPYFSGGEMFDLLHDGQRRSFSETEARYLLRNILDGLETLQIVGLCHRDISLENILINDENTCVIDMGMCIRIPFLDDEVGYANIPRNINHQDIDEYRCLISERPACGKMYYMSPEVLHGEVFDGHAVDLWAVGVCLFMMLTGQPAWEMARETDACFRYIAVGGQLARVLDHWNIHLSSQALNLLQNMLRANPRDRLNLQQVRDHAWMNGEEMNPITNTRVS